MFEVVDNFLDKSVLNNITNKIFSNNFPWYFNPKSNGKGFSNNFYFQYTHVFYDHLKGGINSEDFNILKPLLDKLNVNKLHRVKANSTTKTHKIIQYPFHRDQPNLNNSKASIFYLNTNNGFTLFKNKEKIKSKKNRLSTFKANEYHCATSCTDQLRRLVININYE